MIFIKIESTTVLYVVISLIFCESYCELHIFRGDSQINGGLVHVVHDGIQDFVIPKNSRIDKAEFFHIIQHYFACSDNLEPPPKKFRNAKWVLLSSNFRCGVDEMIINAERKVTMPLLFIRLNPVAVKL